MDTLLTLMRSKATLIEVTDNSELSQALADKPTAVFVLDGDIFLSSNWATARQLVNYTTGGGTVVLGGLTAMTVMPNAFNATIWHIWDLPWRCSYHGCYEAFLSGFAIADKMESKNTISLPVSTSGAAVCLSGVDREDRVYAQMQLAESPTLVALTHYGSGFVGWVGDVNCQEELDQVNLTMLLHPKSKNEG